MENWKKEFIAELKAERTTYADMIDFCCDNMVLNNSIIETLTKKAFILSLTAAAITTKKQTNTKKYISISSSANATQNGLQIIQMKLYISMKSLIFICSV